MTLDPLAAVYALRNAPWRARAACTDPELMYDPKRELEAKAICRGCPVRVECFSSALERNEPDGVWGGFNPAERRELEDADPADFPEILHKFAQADRSRGRRAS